MKIGLFSLKKPANGRKAMGFKKMNESFTFSDLAMTDSLEHNRSLRNMEKLEKSINWSRIDSILMSHYKVGTSVEGTDAFPPLLLFKCLLLQKWYRIPSDPALEHQIHPVKYALRAFA